MKWEYGLTTVPLRFKTTLPTTLASLGKAGFPYPRLFVDGSKNHILYEETFGLEITCRWPGVKTAGNWILSAWELYLRNPWADRYAIFQDDFVAVKNLKGYLDRVEYPGKGYLNLYSFPENSALCPKADGKPLTGFYKANQLGKGAVALVFDNDCLSRILGHSHLMERTKHPTRGVRNIDGGIVDTCRQLGYTEFVHSPSLVQHVGHRSSMGNPTFPMADNFPGDSFDAMTLLQ